MFHRFQPLPAGWSAGPLTRADFGRGPYPARVLTGPEGERRILDAVLVSRDGTAVLDGALERSLDPDAVGTPWAGGVAPPADWDGSVVRFRNGVVGEPYMTNGGRWDHHRGAEDRGAALPGYDITAYNLYAPEPD